MFLLELTAIVIYTSSGRVVLDTKYKTFQFFIFTRTDGSRFVHDKRSSEFGRSDNEVQICIETTTSHQLLLKFLLHHIQ